MDHTGWALIVDFWRSRGWQNVGILLSLLMLPCFMYTGIYGVADYHWQNDESSVILHVVFTGVTILALVSFLLTWLPTVGREYTLPITTWKMVAIRSVSGALGAATGYLFIALTVNWLFQVDWPLEGPLLMIVSSYLVAQAIAWFSGQSTGLGLVLFAPLCVLGAWWFSLRYQVEEILESGSHNMQMWSQVNWQERLALLVVGGVGVWGSYRAAQRQRVGDRSTLAGTMRQLAQGAPWPLIQRLSDYRGSEILQEASLKETSRDEQSSRSDTSRSDTAEPGFQQRRITSESALHWREWNERGRHVPILYAVGLICVGVLVFLLAEDAHQAINMGSAFSLVGALGFGLLGMYLGHRSHSQEFPGFAGTRPLTDHQWSTVLMRNMTKSTLIACSIWSLGMVLLVAMIWGFSLWEVEVSLHFLLANQFKNFPGTLAYQLAMIVFLWWLGCWTLSANGMMLALLRRWASQAILLGSMGLFILMVLATELSARYMPFSMRDLIPQGIFGLMISIPLVFSFGAFGLALWHGKILGRTALLCLVAWLLLVVVCLHWFKGPYVFNHLPDLHLWIEIYCFGSLLTFPFLPVAGTPLAVAWNRHR